MRLTHPQYAKWWVTLALKLQFNYHSVDSRILIFLYEMIDSVGTCISPSLVTTKKIIYYTAPKWQGADTLGNNIH